MISIEQDLHLPDSLRDELRKPFGRLLECEEMVPILKGTDEPVITIGDSVSISLIELGVSPSLIIWDGKTRRLPCNEDALQTLEEYAPIDGVANPPGVLTKEAWELVTSSLNKARASILVDGEEDLLTIPAIMNSNEGSQVVYGSPGKGAILIVVDQKIKAVFQDIISRFESK